MLRWNIYWHGWYIIHTLWPSSCAKTGLGKGIIIKKRHQIRPSLPVRGTHPRFAVCFRASDVGNTPKIAPGSLWIAANQYKLDIACNAYVLRNIICTMNKGVWVDVVLFSDCSISLKDDTWKLLWRKRFESNYFYAHVPKRTILQWCNILIQFNCHKFPWSHWKRYFSVLQRRNNLLACHLTSQLLTDDSRNIPSVFCDTVQAFALMHVSSQ